MSTKLKFIIVAAVAIVALLGLASVAVAFNETPHGGYDSSTNKCLNCHDIHTDAPDFAEGVDADYVLLRWTTVVDTCGSCHDLYQGEDSPDSDEPYGTYTYQANQFSGTPGTASDRTAYKVDYGEKDDVGGHHMSDPGAGNDTIPGGSDELNAINIWLDTPSYSDGFSMWSPYDPDAPNLAQATEFEGTNGLYCASCHTPHADFGQELESDAGFNPDGGIEHTNKLLSSRPNHSSTDLNVDDLSTDRDERVTEWAVDGYNYCLACHDQRAPDHTEGWYNHPVEFCLICHADDRDGTDWGGDYDFPHTSEIPMLLAEEPDGICITCHTEGSLP